MPKAVAVPEAMQQRRKKKEREHQHRAFLLWAMQAPEHRSYRGTARAMGYSGAAVRKWAKRHQWRERIADVPDHEEHAAELYADQYHSATGGAEVHVIEERLRVAYRHPGPEQKTELAKANDLYDRAQRAALITDKVSESDKRTRHLSTALYATLNEYVKALKEGQIEVKKTSDLGQIIRGFGHIEEAQKRQIEMLPDADDEGDGRRRENVATSQRVLQARDRGGDVLAAIEEDAEELLLAVRTMRTHESESNVVTFPAGQDTAEATGDGG